MELSQIRLMTKLILFMSIICSSMYSLPSAGSLSPIITSALFLPPRPNEAGAVASWTYTTADLPNGDQRVPCPTGCWYGIIMVYANGTNMPLGEVPQWSNPTSNYSVNVRNETWESAAKKFFALGPPQSASSTWPIGTKKGARICIGVSQGIPGITPSSAPFRSQVSGNCAGVIDVPNSCTSTAALTIDYGTLPVHDLNGATAEAEGVIECTTPATVKVGILPTDINMGGGIVSHVTVNGLETDGRINVDGSTRLVFSSRLSTTGTPTVGKYSGSTVVLLNLE